MFEMFNVTLQDYWTEKITFSKQIHDPATEMDCFNLCIIVKREECDLLVFDHENSTCYLGMLSETSGKNSFLERDFLTLHASKSKH